MGDYKTERDYLSERGLSRRLFLGGSIATTALIAASPLEVLAHEESTSITFARGAFGEKVVDGFKIKVQPSAVYDGTSMGIALRQKCGHGQFWGVFIPRLVLATYRGMKIAEKVEKFEDGTLCACWYAGKRKSNSGEQDYVDEIEAKIGKEGRERILYTIPPNFEDMLTKLSDNRVDIAGWEIEDEVKEGVLAATPRVQAFLDAYHRKVELDSLRYRNISGGFEW